MAPPLFADVSKTANDLFVKDYKDFSGKFEVANSLANGVNLKTTLTRSEKNGAIATTLEGKKKVGNTDWTLKYSSSNALTIVAENSSIMQNLKLKAEQSIAASAPAITAEYKTPDVSGSAVLDAGKQTASLSAVTSRAGVLLGISSTYNLASGTFSNSQLKGHFNGPNYEVAASVEGGDKLGVSFYQKVQSDLALAVSLNKSKDVSLAVGGAYTIDKSSTVRGTVDSAGALSMLYTQKVRPEVTLKVLAQVNAFRLNNGPRVGLNLNVNV